MYESYYKLSGKPFQLAPDPYFFFGSSTHKRALAYLKYGVSQSEGFIVVTGDVGTGKSTLVRTLFNTLEQKNDLIAGQLMNTQLDSTNILRMVAATFGLAHQAADKTSLLKNIENFLMARQKEGKRCMLVVDEAQNLPFESLEELRMLSNLHFKGKILLQIFLLGQSEFRDNLRHPNLEQVRQRITASYHLAHLDPTETVGYVEHRLKKVDWKNDPEFTKEAYQAIYEYTAGVPRRINTLCDRLLLFGFLEEKHVIDEAIVRTVAQELRAELMVPESNAQPVRSNGNAANHPAASAPINGVPLSGADAGNLEQRIAQLEFELERMRRRFDKERDFMRKVVAISFNFDDHDETDEWRKPS
ncbi:MAG: XrtA/PEP-CTERM system-associated ATPase [Pseudomonadota bacterium]